jgi:hypothetical protein
MSSGDSDHQDEVSTQEDKAGDDEFMTQQEKAPAKGREEDASVEGVQERMDAGEPVDEQVLVLTYKVAPEQVPKQAAVHVFTEPGTTTFGRDAPGSTADVRITVPQPRERATGFSRNAFSITRAESGEFFLDALGDFPVNLKSANTTKQISASDGLVEWGAGDSIQFPHFRFLIWNATKGTEEGAAGVALDANAEKWLAERAKIPEEQLKQTSQALACQGFSSVESLGLLTDVALREIPELNTFVRLSIGKALATNQESDGSVGNAAKKRKQEELDEPDRATKKLRSDEDQRMVAFRTLQQKVRNAIEVKKVRAPRSRRKRQVEKHQKKISTANEVLDKARSTSCVFFERGNCTDGNCRFLHENSASAGRTRSPGHRPASRGWQDPRDGEQRYSPQARGGAISGTIERWHFERGFGFIRVGDTGETLFCPERFLQGVPREGGAVEVGFIVEATTRPRNPEREPHREARDATAV